MIVSKDIVVDNYPFHCERNLKGLTIESYKVFNDSVVLSFIEVVDVENDEPYQVEVFDWMDCYADVVAMTQ
jgi:hypothetical protein